MRFLDCLRHKFHVPRMTDRERRRMEQDADPANYPDHLKHLAPTEADLELATEATTGKPVKPESAQQGVTSMQQRIADLEALKAKLVNGGASVLASHLDSVNYDLATARERLAHYQAQIGTQN